MKVVYKSGLLGGGGGGGAICDQAERHLVASAKFCIREFGKTTKQPRVPTLCGEHWVYCLTVSSLSALPRVLISLDGKVALPGLHGCNKWVESISLWCKIAKRVTM